ncbi:unnamed protein product, partial [Boreogadus saida]
SVRQSVLFWPSVYIAYCTADGSREQWNKVSLNMAETRVTLQLKTLYFLANFSLKRKKVTNNDSEIKVIFRGQESAREQRRELNVGRKKKEKKCVFQKETLCRA